jgi:hypothetical protein
MNDTTNELVEGEIIEMPSTALSVISAEIDMQIATAKRFPRRKDREIAVKIMDRAVLTPEIAAECIYSLPRDGKTIVGPSVRFAEIIRSCYGNIRAASRFVRIDTDDRTAQAVIVEAVAYDTEMNDFVSTQVRRSIMTSGKGGNIPRRYSVDMVATTVQAALSIAERNAIIKLVPKALWIDAHQKVLEVVRGAPETLSQRRVEMLKAFKAYGVQAEQLCKAMGIESEQEISLNDMPRLAGMWTALKDGEAIESVLGMAVDRRSKHEKGPNPLSNAAVNLGSGGGGGSSELRVSLATGGSGGAVAVGRTPGPEPRQEPAGETTSEKATRARSGRKNAQAAAASETDAQIAARQEAERNRQATIDWNEAEARREAREKWDTEQAEKARLDAIERQEQEQREAEATASTARSNQPDEPAIPEFLDRKKQQEAAPPRAFYDEAIEFIGTFQGSPGSLMDWWRSKRAERAALPLEQSTRVSQVYTAKFNKLNADGEL